jgi:hypothetical protein
VFEIFVGFFNPFDFFDAFLVAIVISSPRVKLPPGVVSRCIAKTDGNR